MLPKLVLVCSACNFKDLIRFCFILSERGSKHELEKKKYQKYKDWKQFMMIDSLSFKMQTDNLWNEMIVTNIYYYYLE